MANTSYTANNKLLYTYNHSDASVDPKLLSSYAESLIFNGNNRVLWYKGYQFGNTYFGSVHGEAFNDFDHNRADGPYSHAEGMYTRATGASSHAEGNNTYAANASAHTEGNNTYAAGEGSHAEGRNTQATGGASHAEGYATRATGGSSHAEGNNTYAAGGSSHAEGNMTRAEGPYSHAEGYNTQATGISSHTEGNNSRATATNSHAEGDRVQATGAASHAEGYKVQAEGQYSHAEGNNTYATSEGSHAEGYNTYAGGKYSHAAGYGTVTSYDAETAIGKYNISKDDSIFTIGDGESNDNRHNVIEVNKNSTYVNNTAYLNSTYISNAYCGNLTADISNSYVDYTKQVTMDTLIKSLLDEGKYTLPQVDIKFGGCYDLGATYAAYSYFDITDYVDNYDGDGNIVVTLESGTEFYPFVYINWPTSAYGGTRSVSDHFDYSDPTNINIADLGYSYGGADDTVTLYYNAGSEYFDPSVQRDATQAYTFGPDSIGERTCIFGNSTVKIGAPTTTDNIYTIFKGITDGSELHNIEYSYLHASYMPYKQLLKNGIVQFSYGDENPWFENGTGEFPVKKVCVNSREKWFAGVTEELPSSRLDMYEKSFFVHNNEKHNIQSGFINYLSGNSANTECEYKVSLEESISGRYFWILVPANVAPISYIPGEMGIQVTRNDGISWDLVTPLQPLYKDTRYLSFNLGYQSDYIDDSHRMTAVYTMYFVKLSRGPLGRDNADTIKFRLQCAGGFIELDRADGTVDYIQYVPVDSATPWNILVDTLEANDRNLATEDNDPLMVQSRSYGSDYSLLRDIAGTEEQN